MNSAPAHLNQAFAALSDPTRRAIVDRLTQGSVRVTDLAEPFQMSLNAVSKHVKVLERAGLVHRRREGREHHITVNAAPIREIASWALNYEELWKHQLNRLEEFLLKQKNQPKGKP